MARTKQTAVKLSRKTVAKAARKAELHAERPAERKKPRFHAGTVATRDMMRYQDHPTKMLRKIPFQRLVREVASEFGAFRFQRDAITALREASEKMLHDVFQAAITIKVAAGHPTRKLKKKIHPSDPDEYVRKINHTVDAETIRGVLAVLAVAAPNHPLADANMLSKLGFVRPASWTQFKRDRANISRGLPLSTPSQKPAFVRKHSEKAKKKEKKPQTGAEHKEAQVKATVGAKASGAPPPPPSQSQQQQRKGAPDADDDEKAEPADDATAIDDAVADEPRAENAEKKGIASTQVGKSKETHKPDEQRDTDKAAQHRPAKLRRVNPAPEPSTSKVPAADATPAIVVPVPDSGAAEPANDTTGAAGVDELDE